MYVTDVYSQAGDSELSTMSPKEKSYTACERSGLPKEFFHIESRKTHCTQCLEDFNIDS